MTGVKLHLTRQILFSRWWKTLKHEPLLFLNNAVCGGGKHTLHCAGRLELTRPRRVFIGAFLTTKWVEIPL